MCYRYKVLASQYHRGKLRIYYDSNDLTSTPPEGLLPCTVLDLAEASEVVIKVPMATSVPWLKTLPHLNGLSAAAMGTVISGTSPTITYSSALFNGTLRVEVMQKLTAPDALVMFRFLLKPG
jgi:hypothetical protein